MKRLLDSSFKYTRAADTDVRKTFERIRRAQRTAQRKDAGSAASTKIVQFTRNATAVTK